ncbi:MAG TPA: polymer-forming cytoskeletal protein [Methanosarcinaceae archaeon]|nr:polymer-forming cytoskeletal protein [Methanosarcinaceae archaeon]
MNNEFIKYHAGSDTFIVQKKAYFEDCVTIDGNMMVGAGANFWHGLTVSGSLELGKGSFVKGDVKAENAIIGSRTEITGSIEVVNDLTLLDDVIVAKSATCGGELLVRPGCSIAFAKADSTLELIGKVNIKEIETGTKVIVRSD